MLRPICKQNFEISLLNFEIFEIFQKKVGGAPTRGAAGGEPGGPWKLGDTPAVHLTYLNDPTLKTPLSVDSMRH